MSPFLVTATVLSLLAVLAVLWPLWRGARAPRSADARREENLAGYRQRASELELSRAGGLLSESDYQAARLELDRLLLDDIDAGTAAPAAGNRRSGAVAVGVCALAIPLLAALLYHAIGAGEAIRLDALLQQLAGESEEAGRDRLRQRIVPLLESLSASRDIDGEYRYLLAQSYMTVERYADAATVYLELAKLYPEDAAIIAQGAQALYLASSRTITPAIQAMIDTAFRLDPAQPTLLGMVGMERFQGGDYRGAIDYWQKLLQRLPPESPDARVIRSGIEMARTRLDEAPGAPQAPASAAGTASGASLQVSVALAGHLKIRDGDTVFVFARAIEGPPMPLAVARFPASELPRRVELNDSMAMAPGLKLSGFSKVRVTARISRGGVAAAQPGDLEGGGEAVSLDGGEQEISILIDRVI